MTKGKGIKSICLMLALAMMVSIFLPMAADAAVTGETGIQQVGSVEKIDPQDIQNGGYYIFAVNGVQSSYGVGTTPAMSNIAIDGADDYGVRNASSFDGTVATAYDTVIWLVEEYEDGYSLKANFASGTNAYLNITEGDGSEAKLSLGPKQALTLAITSDTIKISRTIEGTTYYLRFTGSSSHGQGVQAGIKNSTNTFLVYEVNSDPSGTDETVVLKPESVTQIKELSSSYKFESGYYIFTSKNQITDFKNSYGTRPTFLNSSRSGDAYNARALASFNGTIDDVVDSMIWYVEPYGSGYSMRAYTVDGPDAYLNILAPETSGASYTKLTLGPQQELSFGGFSSTALDQTSIFKKHGSTSYYLRFVSDGDGNGGGSVRAAKSNTWGQLRVYKVNMTTVSAPDVEEERETPRYTIAAISDIHVDYGLQNNENVVRPVTQAALNTIKEKENPDIILSGGDLLSANGGASNWNREKYEKAVQQVTAALSATSKTGKALYINGNHDYEAGGKNFNSGAFIDTAMKNSVGEYEDALYESEDRQSNLLAYHYKIDGIHYIGLNTPYNGDKAVSGYVFTKESVDWVEKKLQTISKNELIIFMAHYPLQDSRGISAASKGLSETYDSNTRLKNILLNYPNLIYLYGHDHGGATSFIDTDTFQRATAYFADGTISGLKNYRASGFTSCFMGSVSYYNNAYNSGQLSATQPKVVQLLMIYVYDDHVELQMKNYGEKTGSRQHPYSYSIDLVQNFVSDEYEVATNLVSGVAHNTTVADFLSGFESSDNLRVIGFDGKVITDTTREVRSDMKVQYVNGETVTKEATIRVNKAAKSDMPYTVQSVTLKNAAGEQVYAVRNASAITAITVQANTEEAGEGVAFVGLYDQNGQLIRSDFAPVNGSGTYDISLSLSELPENATWRATVYSSLATMKAVSYPLTSDNDHYTMATTADSKETEMVTGVDQKQKRLVVFNQNSDDWTQSVVWSWKPTAALGFDNASTFTNPSDAKLRYSDYYGGYVVVTTSSQKFVGIVDYETGESLYSRNAAYGTNPHAIELLPDGNIVLADSQGNGITIFAATQGDGNGYYKKYTLTDAHGLLWDPDYNVLWALGGAELAAYKVTGTLEAPTLEKQADLTFTLPTEHGHDLYPVYGEENKLWVTTQTGLYQFDTDTKTFTSYGDSDFYAELIKSIGNQPYSGTIVRAVPRAGLQSTWVTDTVELFVPQADGSWQKVDKQISTDAYYKARVWYYKYQ